MGNDRGDVFGLSLMGARNMRWRWAIATTVFVTGLMPTTAHAQIEECWGPIDQMDSDEFISIDGPLVPITYWSVAEQNFLVDYGQQFLVQCFEIPMFSGESLRSAMYERDSHQNLINRTRRICRGETGGYGPNWDRFVSSLQSFSALCQ